MKQIFCMGMTLWCFAIHANAQKVDADILIDSIKTEITNFFIIEGLLDKAKVNGSMNYVFATEIKQKRSIGYDVNGVYRIGVFQSHSPMHILIKQKDKFRIYNLEEIDNALKEVIGYSEKNNIGNMMMLVYLKEVIDIYEGNHQPANYKLQSNIYSGG